MKLPPPDFSKINPGIKDDSFKITPGEHLPLWTCDRAIYHIVFHLADSIPRHVSEQLLGERDEFLARLASGREVTEEERLYAQYLFSEKIDNYLDAGAGAAFMKRPENADCVMKALLYADDKDYELYEFAVMPNHVHLIAGFADGSRVKRSLMSIKGFTAKCINRLEARQGAVWAKDSYNRIIRNDQEYRFQRDYVRKNPIRAGLKGWKWVSEE